MDPMGIYIYIQIYIYIYTQYTSIYTAIALKVQSLRSRKRAGGFDLAFGSGKANSNRHGDVTHTRRCGKPPCLIGTQSTIGFSTSIGGQMGSTQIIFSIA